jgi:hypothetical protein
MTPQFRSVPIDGFLHLIRSFESPDPTALPQRSNFGLADLTSAARGRNRDSYKACKDEFVSNHLISPSERELAGLYFFFNRETAQFPFFYIGKADNLFRRVTKHFLTFDYFFYALAFPGNLEKYRTDCMRFYAEGRYSDKRATYERQFRAFELSPFNEIGWISVPELADPMLLKAVEDDSIFFYKPLANGTKGKMHNDANSLTLFNGIRSTVESAFLLP